MTEMIMTKMCYSSDLTLSASAYPSVWKPSIQRCESGTGDNRTTCQRRVYQRCLSYIWPLSSFLCLYYVNTSVLLFPTPQAPLSLLPNFQHKSSLILCPLVSLQKWSPDSLMGKRRKKRLFVISSEGVLWTKQSKHSCYRKLSSLQSPFCMLLH